jgi:hypothetical protein
VVDNNFVGIRQLLDELSDKFGDQRLASPDTCEVLDPGGQSMAFLETVIVKGYATLVDEQTNVSYRDGMAAALKLAEALRQAEDGYDIVQMNVQWGRMINAVKEFIPEEKWPELQARLRGEPPPPSHTTTSRVPHASPIGMVSIRDGDEQE